MDKIHNQDDYDIQDVMSIIRSVEHKSEPQRIYDDPIVRLPGVEISSPLDLPVSSPHDASLAIETIKSRFDDYLDRYNIKVDFNLEDAFQNLKILDTPEKVQIYTYALSDYVDKVRLVGLSRLAVALTVAINKITDPAFVASLDPVDAVGYTDRIFGQLEKVSKLKSLLKVKDPEIEMQHLLNNTGPKSDQTRADEAKVLAILKEIDGSESV